VLVIVSLVSLAVIVIDGETLPAAQDEPCGDHAPDTPRLPFDGIPFIEHRVAIPGLDVGEEVDVPPEDVREVHDDLGIHPRLHRRLVE